MRIAICDDNFECIKQIKGFINNFSEKLTEIDEFSSGEEIVDVYNSKKAEYDVIFLDMELGGLNGIETGMSIRNYDSDVIIVFVTSYTQYMQESFECQPFRFLVKPVNENDVLNVMDAITKKISSEKKTFIFSENRNTVRLFTKDIAFFESRAHYLYIHTDNTTYRIVKTLSALCADIGSNEFCRVHNSFAVNMNFIKEIKSNEILLHDGNTVPLGRKYKKDFMVAFLEFKERKYFI